MRGTTAAILFVVLCAVVAVLLLAGHIPPVWAAGAFALALALLGVASGGFRKA